jgi:hypothetical protein
VISISQHLGKFVVSAFLIKLCRATILKDPSNLVQDFLVQKSLKAGNDDVSITVSANVVTTNRSMNCG